jgi:hypothetical protein
MGKNSFPFEKWICCSDQPVRGVDRRKNVAVIASSLFSEMHFESGAEVYLPFNQNRIIEYLCRASFRHQLRNVANIQMASKPDIFD